MSLIKNRADRIRNELIAHDIDVLLIPLGTNAFYTFGIKEEPSERLLLGIISTEEPELTFIAPKFEVTRIKKKTGIENILGWDDKEDPYSLLKKQLSEKKIKTIGLEPKMWFTIYNRLKLTFPEIEFVDTANIFNKLRQIKDDIEINNLRKASKISGETIINFIENDLEAGMTEIKALEVLTEKLKKIQPDNQTFGLVQFGENSAIPHHRSSDRKLKADDVVLIDAGSTWNGYWGDITLTAYFGSSPPEKVKRVFNIVLQANQKAKEAVAQGKNPAEIDTAAREHITKAGYGEFFTHRTGHGLGIEIHEEPFINITNTNPLKTGNAFTIEPGIYLPGEFGIRVEDNIIKTDDGYLSTEFDRHSLMKI